MGKVDAKLGAKTKLAALLGAALPVVALDQWTKYLALTYLTDNRRIALIGEYLSLRLIRNPGAAFSFLSGATWVFTVFALIIITAIFLYSRRVNKLFEQVALGMLLGGAVGNLIDRIIQPPSIGMGHVIDFISYGNLFIGNIADIFIVVIAGLLCVKMFFASEDPHKITGQTELDQVAQKAEIGSKKQESR